MDRDDELDDTPLITRIPSHRAVNREVSSHSHATQMPEAKISESLKSVQHKSILKYRVTFLQAMMFATALEDALKQVRILGEGNNHLRIYKTNKELDDLRRKKYGIECAHNEDELEGVDPKNLESEHHKLNKLANDRQFCIDILTQTYVELALRQTYSPLIEAKIVVQDRFDHYFALIEDEARNRANSREIYRQLRQQRNRSRSVIYDTNVAVEKLRNEVEDATLNMEVRNRYIDKWETSREEQNAWRIADKETKPTELITYYRKQLEAEQRVHFELDLHTNMLIDEIIKKLDVWVDRYDEDTADVDLKIQIKKIDVTSQQETREEMEKMLDIHEKEITKWKQFKEDREKALQYRNKMTEAAHIVQAWWRGLLVRQQLGPYKPRKKPLPKPKPEKKKK